MSPYARMLATGALLALVVAGCTDARKPDRPPAPDKVTYTSYGQFGRDAYVHLATVKDFFAPASVVEMLFLPYSDLLADLPGLWVSGRLAGVVPATDAEAAAAELALIRPYVGTQPFGSIDPARIARAIAILHGAGAILPGLPPERLVAFDLASPGAGW